MLKAIQQLPQQFEKGWQLGAGLDAFEDFRPRRLYLAGMGGSSLPVDIINDCFGDRLDPIFPLRDYVIPDKVSSSDLIICSSYSGDTEETLVVLKAALARQIPVLVLTHGGQLKEMATHKKLPLILIPQCPQPRLATGYFFASLIFVLQKMGLISFKLDAFKQLENFLEKQKVHHDHKGQELAQKFKDHVPIIYAPTELYAAARIWKIKINENAKAQSFFNVVPELNHNEMVGWTQLMMKPFLVLLKSPLMDEKNARRMSVMEEILSPMLPIEALNLSGDTTLQVIFDALGYADYSSYYLAKAYGVDPVPVEMVEDFKKKLAQKNSK